MGALERNDIFSEVLLAGGGGSDSEVVSGADARVRLADFEGRDVEGIDEDGSSGVGIG